MIDPKLINELSEKLASVIPNSAAVMCQDIQKNFHDILQASLDKMDLVTRDEFDAQVQVLNRTRTKLEELERKLDEYEKSNHSQQG